MQVRQRGFEGDGLTVEINRDARHLLFEQALPRAPTGHRLLGEHDLFRLAQQMRPVPTRGTQEVTSKVETFVGEDSLGDIVGDFGPLELEEHELRADLRRPILDPLHARAARGIGGVGREIEADVAAGPADQIVNLGEAVHELGELPGVELRDVSVLRRELVGPGVSLVEQGGETVVAGLGQERFEVPNDVGRGEVCVGYAHIRNLLGHNPCTVKEVCETFDQVPGPQARHRHPLGAVDVVARPKRGSRPREAGEEVEDHEVVLGVDPLDPPRELTDRHLEAGLLADLAGDGVREALAAFDPTAGHRPLPHRGRAGPSHEQQLALVDDDCADGELGAAHSLSPPLTACGAS